MIDYIKQRLRGALELTLFIKGSEKAFRGTTFKAMLWSFAIPLLFLPYGIWGMSLTHKTELQELSKLEGINNLDFGTYVGLSFIKALSVTLFMIFVMYYFAKWMERSEYFYDLIAAGNWIGVIKFFIYLPITIIIVSGGQDWTGVYMLATITILYSLGISIFATTRLLNIPWELATACAIFGLAVGETANKILHLVGLNYFS